MATRTYQNEKGKPGPRLLRLRFVWLLFIYSLHAGAIWRSFNSVCSHDPSLPIFPASNLYSVQENLPSRQLSSRQVTAMKQGGDVCIAVYTTGRLKGKGDCMAIQNLLDRRRAHILPCASCSV